uniref:Uncharacterized protein n=1 Tax=Arundo donax TaxID=35708 RepID=A0A0A9GH00_ARUDO
MAFDFAFLDKFSGDPSCSSNLFFRFLCSLDLVFSSFQLSEG